MLNILHINVNYTGTALHQTMIEHLDKYTTNQVFAPTYPITEDQLAIKPNKNVVISQCYNRRDRYIFLLKQQKIFRSLKQNIDIKKYDVVHAYTLFTDGNCALNVKKKYGVPYIVAVRDTDVNFFFKKAVHLRSRGIKIMREAEKVIFLSRSYKDAVIKRYVPQRIQREIEKKSVIIPNGINDMWFDNLFFERDIKQSVQRFHDKIIRVVCVGILTKRKNYVTTIEALKILKERGWNVSLDAVGQLIDKGVYESIIKNDFVTYYEKQPLEKIVEFYRSNDVFVMPSLTETFGLTYAEALSQMLPVIYTKGQGFDKQFPDSYVGFPVDPLDPEEIADKIENICEFYPQLCANCVEGAHKFNWNNIVEEYLEIYDKIKKGY